MLKGSLISLVGISSIGISAFLSYSMEGEKQVQSIPKLVLSSKEKNGTQLSWDYKSFLEDGKIKEGKIVSFKDSKMKIGSYQLKEGDILCSPDQDGNYLVLRKGKGPRDGYKIEGNNQVWVTCPARGFFEKNPNVKSIQFKGFSIGQNLYISTIFISSCFFELNKNDSKLEIMWDKCRSKEYNGQVFGKTPLKMDD